MSYRGKLLRFLLKDVQTKFCYCFVNRYRLQGYLVRIHKMSLLESICMRYKLKTVSKEPFRHVFVFKIKWERSLTIYIALKNLILHCIKYLPYSLKKMMRVNGVNELFLCNHWMYSAQNIYFKKADEDCFRCWWRWLKVYSKRLF